ncbi:GGDEF domain-containing protein [Nocardioides antri]|uniref:GGDEF domain-containing protein n=1 Tax=Nocardioides antri TaxID=2607659 RepID=A0A5B1M858_9ACTN|nr:GGDEF domain-containing protein [Nocardioides antri]KAA1428708.1 GGDEF domain-containing protein [Nocardioides antri]
MQPRDHRAAARSVIALCAVAAVVTLVLSPFQSATSQPGVAELVTGTAMLTAVVLLCVAARYDPRANTVAWVAGPLLAVATIVVLDLMTNDATVAAQIFFVFPILYGASQLRPAGSAVMTAAALAGELIVVGAQLPLQQAVVDGGYVGAALITVSVLLTITSERQARLVAQLEQMAAVDSLTGLVTRRVFDEAATSALSGASSEEGTSLILLDVDHFKSINDQYGHPAGDEVLVQLAELLVSRTRRGDVVCRLGGDEIAVLLPACSREDAETRAEEMLADVRVHTFSLAESEGLQVTISVGLAHAPSHATDLRRLYSAADRALYKAKKTGRGRVAVAEAPAKDVEGV